MDKLLADKAAVVTGAASGNGRAIARTFAEQGADVIIADIRESPRENGSPTHEVIEADTDSNCQFVRCDVTNVPDLKKAVDAADQFGGIDIMINNAGIMKFTNFLDIDVEEYNQLMDINSKGVFFGSQFAAKKMVENGDEGVIINMSSGAGLRGGAQYVHYSASKGAVRLMTYAMAAALGDSGIRVNAIHPGVIKTELTAKETPMMDSRFEDAVKDTIPLDRFGEPHEVADAALYLSSDMATFVSGESLIVDGGSATTW